VLLVQKLLGRWHDQHIVLHPVQSWNLTRVRVSDLDAVLDAFRDRPGRAKADNFRRRRFV
jgi:hypothetical protein